MPKQRPGLARCSALDASHRALVGELSSLNVSHRAARANVGDTSRLRWHLGRCTAALGASALPRSTLRVLAIGCSMTQGQMNCGGKLEGELLSFDTEAAPALPPEAH